MNKLPQRTCAAALAAVICLWGMAPNSARADMSENQLRAGLEQMYDVQVLKMRPSIVAGRPAFLVTVMRSGGDFNDSFRVSTLAVDAATGKLVPGFRHHPSGLTANQSPSYRTGRQPTDSFRQGFSWR